MLRGHRLPARDRCQLAALDRPRHQHDEHDDRRDLAYPVERLGPSAIGLGAAPGPEHVPESLEGDQLEESAEHGGQPGMSRGSFPWLSFSRIRPSWPWMTSSPPSCSASCRPRVIASFWVLKVSYLVPSTSSAHSLPLGTTCTS